MSAAKNRQLVGEVFDANKWKDILNRFVDVIKINLFIVDFEGQIILPPVKDRFGWSFFARYCLEVGSVKNNLLAKYQKNDYLEFRCECGFQSVAIPVFVNGEKEPLVYLVVGPIILNKKEESSFYQAAAEKLKANLSDLLSAVNETRVISHISMKAVLDLLSEVAKDVIELKLEKKKLSLMRINREELPKEVSDAAQDIYANIHLDELLVTLLDLALKITNTECGSIMVMDEERQELSVKVSRGLAEERLQSAKLKVGQGIAGLAAQENSAFIIHGTSGENRIKHLLHRQDIKHAIIMPLTARQKVFGVLNLHTKQEHNEIEDSLDNLQYLSRLISAAFQSI